MSSPGGVTAQPVRRSGRHDPARLRSIKNSAITRIGGRLGDQRSVWRTVAEYRSNAGLDEGGTALEDVDEQAEADERPVEVIEGQSGIVVATGRRIIGTELFDSEETLRALRARTPVRVLPGCRGRPWRGRNSRGRRVSRPGLAGRTKRGRGRRAGRRVASQFRGSAGSASNWRALLCTLRHFQPTRSQEDEGSRAALAGAILITPWPDWRSGCGRI